MLLRTLKWPIISLLITGGVHFTIEAILPDLKTIFAPAVLAPLLLSFGIWTGYKAVRFGGNYGEVIIAGAILGVLPLLLDVFGFGMILGRGVTVGLLAGIFGFSIVLWGSLVGGGFELSKE